MGFAIKKYTFLRDKILPPVIRIRVQFIWLLDWLF
jgi:hypothetical protein